MRKTEYLTIEEARIQTMLLIITGISHHYYLATSPQISTISCSAIQEKLAGKRYSRPTSICTYLLPISPQIPLPLNSWQSFCHRSFPNRHLNLLIYALYISKQDANSNFLVNQRRKSFLLKILVFAFKSIICPILLIHLKHLPITFTDPAKLTIMKGSFSYSATDYNLFHKYFSQCNSTNIYWVVT